MSAIPILIRNSVWEKISDQFTPSEKVALLNAVSSHVPDPGFMLAINELELGLALKLTAALEKLQGTESTK